MQTKVRSKPGSEYLTVGCKIEIRPEILDERGYLLIRHPKGDEKIIIIDFWDCPLCGKPFNLAEVVVNRGVIQSITAIDPTQDILDRAHFISDELIFFRDESVKGKKIEAITREDITKMLCNLRDMKS
jgi:hypothetical protein